MPFSLGEYCLGGFLFFSFPLFYIIPILSGSNFYFSSRDPVYSEFLFIIFRFLLYVLWSFVVCSSIKTRHLSLTRSCRCIGRTCQLAGLTQLEWMGTSWRWGIPQSQTQKPFLLDTWVFVSGSCFLGSSFTFCRECLCFGSRNKSRLRSLNRSLI